MTEFVKAVGSIVPAYPFEAAVPQSTPYATYLLRETPIRTKDGIAGHEGTLTLSIYSDTLSGVEAMANRLISLIDGKSFDNRKYYYADIDGSDYPDDGLISKDITFNTLS